MSKKSNIIKIKDKELKLLLLNRFFEQRFWDIESQKTTKQQVGNLKFLMLTFLPLFVISLVQLLIEICSIKKTDNYERMLKRPPYILALYPKNYKPSKLERKLWS